MLVIAGILAAITALLGVKFAPQVEVGNVVGNIVQNGWSFIFVPAWAAGCFWPLWRKHKVTYAEASCGSIVAFTSISILLYYLILYTGSLSRSPFSGGIFVILSIAALVPESILIRIVLALIILGEATFLILNDNSAVQHDLVMVAISIIANVFAAFVRIILDGFVEE